MPLYEFEEGASRKFYRIDLDGRRVLLHWGRIGTEGEHQILSFESEGEARHEYDAQCEKRTEKRGYRLVVDEGLPHDPEVVSRQRLAKIAPLSDSPRFLFTKRDKFVWVEARGAVMLSVKGLRADEDRILPTERKHASPAAAIAARDAMMARLLGQGYQLETFGTSEKAAPKPAMKKQALSDVTALEHVIEEDPFDEGAWSVLEDRLLEDAGDPRGELLRLAKERNVSEEAQQRGAVLPLLLGKNHKALFRAMAAAKWRGGHVIEARFAAERTPGPLLEALLETPAARLIRTLELVTTSPRASHELATIVARSPRRSLRELRFDTRERVNAVLELDASMFEPLALRVLASTSSHLPLRRVAALPTLERISVSEATLAGARRLLTGTLPALHSLELDLGDPDDVPHVDPVRRRAWLGGLVDTLEPILSRAFAPELRTLHVRLRAPDASEAVREALAGRVIARQLVLEVSP